MPARRVDGLVLGGDLLLASCVDSAPLAHADPPVTAIDLRPRGCRSTSVRRGTLASAT
ncbi:hypothetical protein [Actinophytocola algeriensis]|uniref:Uncharacterized protein n=1 Tax=Actinophytocola algeriensis TaxID=1768010 RepID=A0A7W7VD39_9PSEU|nr:hypothetical protein [Actinophytocola algeriensis]MBB4905761.1 hypothetical protein [Actinophytocola algeriensis]MBE1472554.1 hypothetical protein [Actinophytocola algeriensis]